LKVLKVGNTVCFRFSKVTNAYYIHFRNRKILKMGGGFYEG